MPDMNRTSASANSATLENIVSKPTGTRWLVLLLISFMYLITYMDRSNISVAAPAIAREFGLSKTAMGWVFSAFTLAYALGQFPGGWLGDRIGPRKVLTVIMFWWAIAAVSTGAAVGIHYAAGRTFSAWTGRGRRVSRGDARNAALVSQGGTRAHPGHHSLLQPVCCGRDAVCRRRNHERVRLARHFLHFRIARRDLGRGFWRDLSQSPRGSQRRQPCGTRAYPRPQRRTARSSSSKPQRAAMYRGNSFCARRTCGTSPRLTAVFFTALIFFSHGTPPTCRNTGTSR